MSEISLCYLYLKESTRDSLQPHGTHNPPSAVHRYHQAMLHALWTSEFLWKRALCDLGGHGWLCRKWLSELSVSILGKASGYFPETADYSVWLSCVISASYLTHLWIGPREAEVSFRASRCGRERVLPPFSTLGPLLISGDNKGNLLGEESVHAFWIKSELSIIVHKSLHSLSPSCLLRLLSSFPISPFYVTRSSHCHLIIFPSDIFIKEMLTEDEIFWGGIKSTKLTSVLTLMEFTF